MTGYMAEMRKLVGHKTVIQCAASIICIDDTGKLLLGRRSDNHMWGYSGGAVDIDENAEDCAKRELLEEMGITAEALEFFCVNSGPETHYIYPNGDEVSNFEIVYLCRKWHGRPEAKDGEMEELKFFSIDEIDLNQISPPTRRVVADYIGTVKGCTHEYEEKFYFEVPTISRKDDAIDYIDEFKKYGSEINGTGGLNWFTEDYEGWLKKLDEDNVHCMVVDYKIDVKKALTEHSEYDSKISFN